MNVAGIACKKYGYYLLTENVTLSSLYEIVGIILQKTELFHSQVIALAELNFSTAIHRPTRFSFDL